MSALAYVLAILCGVLAGSGWHRPWTLALAIAFIALGLLLQMFWPYPSRRVP